MIFWANRYLCSLDISFLLFPGPDLTQGLFGQGPGDPKVRFRCAQHAHDDQKVVGLNFTSVSMLHPFEQDAVVLVASLNPGVIGKLIQVVHMVLTFISVKTMENKRICPHAKNACECMKIMQFFCMASSFIFSANGSPGWPGPMRCLWWGWSLRMLLLWE